LEYWVARSNRAMTNESVSRAYAHQTYLGDPAAPQALKLRSSANLLLVSAVCYGGLALRTLTMTCWKHLSGSLFSVLEDLNLLQGDEAAGHHLVKDGQETVDAVFAIDDFD